MRGIAGVLSGFAALAAGHMAHGGPFSPEIEAALRRAKNLHVATQRADGARSSVAPVWFMYDGSAVYFATGPRTYKARRIRRGSPLFVWVGRKDGPYFEGRAELLTDPAVAATMTRAYVAKYWLAWLGLFRPSPERLRAGKIVIVRVTPAKPAHP